MTAKLRNDPIALGDTVYSRQYKQFGIVTSLGTEMHSARFEVGDIYFSPDGKVGGISQIGWGEPYEFWPDKNQRHGLGESIYELLVAARKVANHDQGTNNG